MTDPIADFLTRLRNAIQAKHRVVEVPASNLKKDITKILFDQGYILNYKFEEDGPQGSDGRAGRHLRRRWHPRAHRR